MMNTTYHGQLMSINLFVVSFYALLISWYISILFSLFSHIISIMFILASLLLLPHSCSFIIIFVAFFAIRLLSLFWLSISCHLSNAVCCFSPFQQQQKRLSRSTVRFFILSQNWKKKPREFWNGSALIY